MTRKVASKNYRGQNTKNYKTVNTEPSRTVQSDAHLADINQIMRNFAEDGQSILDNAELQFLDVTEFTDYQDLMIEVQRAETDFLKLPSKVREAFGHDVARFLDTAHDPDKRQLLVEAGILKAVETDTQDPPRGAPAPEPAEESGGAEEPST